MNSFDYIIVGAGSAGCVVAARLLAAGKSILLLEAGRSDNNPYIHIPATLQKMQGTDRLWTFQTEPEPSLLDRRVPMKTGRTLGGGSSVNGMVYVRGRPQDYDGWRDQGCEGWGWNDVLPIYKRSEANQRLDGAFHGVDGPLKISDAPYRHPLSVAFVQGAQEAGLPYNDDFNGAKQEGVGFYQTTTYKGLRQSTSVAFLSRYRGSRLLTLRTEALVQTIILENGAADGVVYRTKDGALHEARVREELVLCAGTFGSAKALQLSGIGPGSLLKEFGIAIRKDLPGVGQNFQEHFQAGVFAQTRLPISLKGEDQGLRAVRNGLEWLLFRKGKLTSNVIEAGGFLDTRGTGDPDIQLTMVPVLTGDADRQPFPGHGISVSPCVLRPTSRGSVQITSSSPTDTLRIRSNALSTREDIETLVRGLKIVRRIMRAPSLEAVIEKELAPGTDFSSEPSDTELEVHARRFAKTIYHPVGTCRMGRGPEAVVDPHLRVIGVPRLRVADASIMPTLISGNTNAAAIMIGERCADFLLGA